MKTPAYIAGQQAYFDGYNPLDVEKFYQEETADAKEWMKGLMDAKNTADVLGVPRRIFCTPSRLDTVIIDPEWTRDAVGNHCLIVQGGNPNRMKDLVAYIDTVPRVRVRMFNTWLPGMNPEADPESVDQLNWVARGFPVLNEQDAHAKHWCDLMLIMLGFTFAR